jgi:pimeloyl-ACP methyl ester carboxylesterase
MLCSINDRHANTKFAVRLNSTSFGWQSQIEYFGHLPGYSCLVFDNRGVGNSGAPRGPYSYVALVAICVQQQTTGFIARAAWRRMLLFSSNISAGQVNVIYMS